MALAIKVGFLMNLKKFKRYHQALALVTKQFERAINLSKRGSKQF